jgi:hypothetical protein
VTRLYAALAMILAACDREPPVAVHGPPTPEVPELRRIWGRELTVRSGDHEAAFLVGEADGERLELQVLRGVPAAHAEAIIAEKKGMFESLFREFSTGYPGQVTKHISCPDRYRPQYAEDEFPGGIFRYWLGYANANRVAGACAEDLVHYRLLHGFLYCSSGVMVDVDLYTGLDDEDTFQRLLDHMDCEI